jgi:hypothetical protein
MDWTPLYVTFAVLLLALWVIPAGIEIALFRFRCWRVRQERDRANHALSAHRFGHGVPRRSREDALHGLSARLHRMRVDQDNDAA